jgi:hypothetical protein
VCLLICTRLVERRGAEKTLGPDVAGPIYLKQGKSTGPRRSDASKGSPRKRLPEQGGGRNGFGLKGRSGDSMAEMGRGMGGNGGGAGEAWSVVNVRSGTWF